MVAQVTFGHCQNGHSEQPSHHILSSYIRQRTEDTLYITTCSSHAAGWGGITNNGHT